MVLDLVENSVDVLVEWRVSLTAEQTELLMVGPKVVYLESKKVEK